MTAWVRVEESEGFTPPDAGAFDLPPLFDSVEWLTKPVLQIVLSVVIISVFFLLTTRRISVVPGKLQFAAEGVYGFIRNTIGRDILGSEEFRKFLPFLLTLFTFIYVNNVFGVIPLIQFPTDVAHRLPGCAGADGAGSSSTTSESGARASSATSRA